MSKPPFLIRACLWSPALVIVRQDDGTASVLENAVPAGHEVYVADAKLLCKLRAPVGGVLARVVDDDLLAGTRRPRDGPLAEGADADLLRLAGVCRDAWVGLGAATSA